MFLSYLKVRVYFTLNRLLYENAENPTLMDIQKKLSVKKSKLNLVFRSFQEIRFYSETMHKNDFTCPN